MKIFLNLSNYNYPLDCPILSITDHSIYIFLDTDNQTRYNYYYN